MRLLSTETERELLERFEQHLEQRLELAKQFEDGWDLVSRAEVMKKLGVSTTTLSSWEKIGLKQYRPPLESTHKVYYRKTDIYNFLAVD
ncbi:MerR family transcriptional regulator [Streptococcus sp. sy018]|uniref:MerR family transcriptional regulator n=1 Tax=Streptococcus sp. sy018 TaxID=2600147 RepID=UPI0011B68E3C|nr:MerR family transcriptional regulator [Streptococcus sp. sy018]TWS94563.1 MerR family transcriptional regulator [Streptococcus sp. sy018]